MTMRKIVTILLMTLVVTLTQAQITIGGNVYGGGNAGDTGGGTAVTVRAANIHGAVFGGARKANVGGSTYVNIDASRSSGFVLVNRVYGGNDIAGTIGTSETVPSDIEEKPVNNSWNAFVRVNSDKTITTKGEAGSETTVGAVYIGQLFGGGNGDYDYTSNDSPYKGMVKPEMGKTYVEIVGGSIVYAFGGGNNATVKDSTVIWVENESQVVASVKENGVEQLSDERVKSFGVNPGYTYPTSDAFQIGSFFGGNNLAEMAIRPVWNLMNGKIRNLYSGGNHGNMTNPEGLLLEVPSGSKIVVDNLYGGCRMADVRPMRDGKDVAKKDIQISAMDADGNAYKFPAGLSARVLIHGGDVNNVYGGNDISGKVYGGNAIGVYSSIRGNLYGGGNGSYPYTDNEKLKDDPTYSDLYYGDFKTAKGYTSSVEALNAFRPNAESVSIRLIGASATQQTIIGGALFCGGNCATLRNDNANEDAAAELKIGSYVIADKVFLGNNGANMIAEDILKMYAGNIDINGTSFDFSQMNLTNESQFATYMDGVTMRVMPRVVFDDKGKYEPYTTMFGSFYCGGNVGSVDVDGAINVNFNDKVIVYDKVVGGSNEANVYQKDKLNAQFLGGILGKPDANGNKVILNFGGLKMQPKRWIKEDDHSKGLEWNTWIDDTKSVLPTTAATGDATEDDLKRRFKGGNVYGGCYSSGHVNGNVVINLNASLVDRTGDRSIFDKIEQEEGEAKLYGHDEHFKILERRSGVILDQQGMDPLGKALNVFGGGYGADSEIWGGVTINLNKGYTFQIFGGGEKGSIGKADSHEPDPNNPNAHILNYKYDEAYSTCINLRGTYEGTYRGDTDDKDGVVDDPDMAEAEFIYGGSFEGVIAGNTRINLGNGRIFNSFAGSCNADILGHTETYVGLNSSTDTDLGFPWIRDHIYGGNDLGGKILGTGDFTSRVSETALPLVYNPKNQEKPDVLQANAYTEYIQGRVEHIFGGCYGDYDYTDDHYEKYTNKDGSPKAGFSKPYMDNAIVNFKANAVARNSVKRVFGAGQGHGYESESDLDRDKMQDRSYVLVDVAANTNNFAATNIFGAGDFSGVGIGVASETAMANANGVTGSAVIDLVGGYINDVYGASRNEGTTRRTIVNVPDGSALQANNLFGGGYGDDNTKPCDVYETCVNYHAETARLKGSVFGGNNAYRRTLYGKVNVSQPIWQNKESGYLATVYGAGKGEHTWSEYTEVNLLDGARVYEVYGGGLNGRVVNRATTLKEAAATYGDANGDKLKLGAYPDTGLDNDLAVARHDGKKYNTNVLINKGATVVNYAYGGGKGDEKIEKSGDVYGSTYIALLGGTVNKDIYAAGTIGAVKDIFGGLKDEFDNDFVASTTAYIEGGSCRNVYGGGWQGDVGNHKGTDANPNDTSDDILGETNVIIGVRADQGAVPINYGFYNGVPAIQRNVYSGGEGGAVFGTANLTINNGYIGYTYDEANKSYQEKVDDETYYVNGAYAGEGRLKDCGNVFGGGYDVRSSVDFTNVTMWGGVVRNSIHGGGEIATIGRGEVEVSGEANSMRTLKNIFKPGKAQVTMYNGHVMRNVFGGGKGYNIWGYGQQGTLYTDGFVFGQTEVQIHGGEIGTIEGMAQGYGNVFGAGDIGYVYSPSFFSAKTQAKEGTGSPDHIYYYDNDGNLTEDCKVVIAPWLQVKTPGGATINGHHYDIYDYVVTDDLNTLPKKSDDGTWGGGWENLLTEDVDGERGIMIHNAVFGGGNVSSNSDQTYANATTVYGNTTASLYDVFHRDFITVGTEHVGGLYGGGNLSMVDGYRELNITNYGTDYYGLDARISLEKYRALSNRERAYFQLEYVCTGNTETSAGKTGVTIGGEFYEEGQHLTEEKYLKLIETYPAAKDYWEPFGFCSIYAGRLLNTIQRADLCGVFGSRMVLQGAKDRVAEVGENVDYTINRVGELSLNQRRSVAPGDTGSDYLHGNYFGIYSVVNCLGNLTSDVHFSDPYMKADGVEDNTQTFFKYKGDNHTRNNRNIGKSFNQVALASGVFLELTTENSTKDHKEYGLVSGVVELDLINVKQDQVGGGFVYAKNEHRVPRCYPNIKNVLLSEFNKQTNDEAVTYKRLRYSADQPGDWVEDGTAYNVGREIATQYSIVPYQTSGNFIHPTKRIIDDCYPINNAYEPTMDPYAEAHYWYVKGDVYIYDQKVSAYTGSATAYSKEVHLPLTITAASHGKLQLVNVKPNLYAYYANADKSKRIGDMGEDSKPIDNVMVNNESESYKLNDVITWWDWNNLSYAEKQYFVEMTYVNCVSVNVDGKDYEPGTYVMDDKDFDTFLTGTHVIKNAEGETVTNAHEVFRPSNNIGRDTGYLLTFDMNSPSVWDDYYTSTSDNTQKITKAKYEELMAAATTDEARQQLLDNWRIGPTFTPVETGVYGQRHYEVGEIITEDTYRNNMVGSGEQAEVEKAYVATKQVSYVYGGKSKTINEGTAIPETEYNALDATTKALFGSAWVCTNTVKLTNGVYLLNGELKTQEDINALKTTYSAVALEIDQSLTPAYICSKAGGYGGQKFEAGTNYNAIKAWCSLPENDRYDENGNAKFSYNYDALDLLTDADYLQVRSDNPRTAEQAYHTPYSDLVNVEYQAVFHATPDKATLTYSGGTLNNGDAISNETFESQIRNDQRHYTRVAVKAGGETVYIANKNFVHNGTPYGKGQIVDTDVYNNNQNDVDAVAFTNNDMHDAHIYYYCYEDYDNVTKGTVIEQIDYAGLTNDQKYFIIQGREPTEVTTLYVSRQSDIYDVSKERIYTVVYQYTYYEDEDDGSVKLTNELHVVNVRLQLESGAPQIGTLAPPATVLPGTAIGLKAPEVTPGTYEVLSSGWELFASEDDADHHRNGEPFDNGNTPVYWYQNGKNYVAFYSKTYLGKTYSNPVPLSVANYHDMDAVMADKEHHYYVDKTNVDRPCKIYLDNKSEVEGKSDLDLLKDFFDLSMLNAEPAAGSELAGHSLLDNHVQGGGNLEFFLRDNVSPTKYTDWTSIASGEGECFNGNLHGDGYTISGLSKSLFGSLCGNVYNLGVTGSFKTAGVADTGGGYVENCWVKSSSQTGFANDVLAVFGKPSDTSGKQIVNCYYSESNRYRDIDYGRGLARKMTDKEFYDGTVAYNLNGFYLNKRYYDNNTSWTGTKKQYKYLKAQEDGSLAEEPLEGSYPDTYAIYPLTGTKVHGYVEERYADGDFRYADGSIPATLNARTRSYIEGEGADAKVVYYFSPIWPDDYIYFGQMLTFDHNPQHQHEALPSRIVKSEGRLLANDGNNRVCRAPAYYGNSTMSVVHFNPWADLAAYSAPKSVSDTDLKPAYPGMTAVDFAGHNDVEKGYKQGLDGKFFYPPLLDDDGLIGVANNDQTQNLVVYAPAATDNAKTYDVLKAYFVDPDFTDYSEESNLYTDGNNYNRVAVVPTSAVRGHLVESDLTTSSDHLLVDKKAFNAPIAYRMGDDFRMWYQRRPDNYAGQYVDKNDQLVYNPATGWEVVSLPFTAEVVTTQQKGELSHFYKGSTTGHEYWLREFAGNVQQKQEAGVDVEGVYTADFNSPDAGTVDKDYINSFLWDYYYSKDLQRDKNEDQYQEFYKESRTMQKYPYVTAGTPYLVGFPGNLYYEFDLSGNFVPEHTYGSIPPLDEQVITFATGKGASISKTDDVLAPNTIGQYQFVPNYSEITMAEKQGYVLDSIGSSFDITLDGTKVRPFRPYILSTVQQAPKKAPKSIVFNSVNTSLESDGSEISGTEGMDIYAQNHAVVVTSNLRRPAEVCIFNVGGVMVGYFTIQPGETVKKQLHADGVYVVYAAGGRYRSKLAVK